MRLEAPSRLRLPLLFLSSVALGMHTGQISLSGDAPEFSMVVLRFAYDGEEFVHFNYTTKKFVDSSPLLVPYVDELNHNEHVVKNVARYNHYLPFISEVIQQATRALTVKPSITITSRRLSGGGNSLALVCRVDRFYPRDINATWLRNGEDINQRVLKSSILPNQDGTFQIKLHVDIDPSGGDTYACQVEHRSVPDKLNAVWVPKKKNLPVHGYVVGIIAGIIGIVIAVSGGILRWKEVRSQGEADHLCEEIGQLPSPESASVMEP